MCLHKRVHKGATNSWHRPEHEYILIIDNDPDTRDVVRIALSLGCRKWRG